MYFYCFCFFIFVQIIGESLPISSSSHVQLLSVITGMELPEWYYYMLHGSTIAIVLIFFRLKSFKYTKFKRYVSPLIKLIALGICAELPTLFFYLLIKFLSCNFYCVFLPVGLATTALLLYSLRFRSSVSIGYKTTPSFTDAFIIGCAQALSLLPGISRLASTYTIARWRGIESTKALRFSFIIQLPLIIAGFSKGLYEYLTLYKYKYIPELFTYKLFLCVVLATVISYGALYSTWMLAKKEKLWYYAYYLIIPFSISILTLACVTQVK